MSSIPQLTDFSLGMSEFLYVFGVQFCKVLNTFLLVFDCDNLLQIFTVQVIIIFGLLLILTVIESEQACAR